MQDIIIGEFDTLSDKISKYTYFRHLINASKKDHMRMPNDDPNVTIVKGQKSNIFIKSHFEKGRVYLKAESDNTIANGLANLLLKVYSGSSPVNIANADLYFLNEIKLFNYLTTAWQNDLLSILKQAKSIAIKYHLNTYK